MCLTCGCLRAHLDMGEPDVTFEHLKAAADKNGRTVAETLEILQETVDIDRREHAQEYAG